MTASTPLQPRTARRLAIAGAVLLGLVLLALYEPGPGKDVACRASP